MLLGAPLPSHLERQERLSNPMALAILSSDALSSVAYATEGDASGTAPRRRGRGLRPRPPTSRSTPTRRVGSSMNGPGGISGSSWRSSRPPTGNAGGRSKRGSRNCAAAPTPSSRSWFPRWHCAGGSVCSTRTARGRCERRWPARAQRPSSNAGCLSPLPSPSRRGSGPHRAERQELPLEETEEALLVRPDLVDRHVGEPGLVEGADGGCVGLGVRTADHNPGHILLP